MWVAWWWMLCAVLFGERACLVLVQAMGECTACGREGVGGWVGGWMDGEPGVRCWVHAPKPVLMDV